MRGRAKGERRGRRAGVVERRVDVPILVALTAKVAFVIGKGGSVGRGETHSGPRNSLAQISRLITYASDRIIRQKCLQIA